MSVNNNIIQTEMEYRRDKITQLEIIKVWNGTKNGIDQ